MTNGLSNKKQTSGEKRGETGPYKNKINLFFFSVEKSPCGPTAFWAFRDHVSNDVALVVVKYADVKLRDELGCTMLHRIVAKQRLKGKTEVIKMLLERGVDIAARDFEGSTARDYIAIHKVSGIETDTKHRY